MSRYKFDIIVAGSGFAGSIAALALGRIGLSVCLIEKSSHPRFAVGESSTPLADMILRSFSERYGLPFLSGLSRYGSWQKCHPDILCGIKRGFSYYAHNRGEQYKTGRDNPNELLVAASSNDSDSDTNWFRSDVDSFLVQKVLEAGIVYLDKTSVVRKTDRDAVLELEAVRNNSRLMLECELLIDATGSPRLASDLFGVSSSSGHFHTNSFSLYSHFRGVERWSRVLHEYGYYTGRYPYDPDHSALHHLLREGWMWNLRFNNDLLSAGFVIDRTGSASMRDGELRDDRKNINKWEALVSGYPSIQKSFSEAKLARTPGKIIQTGRLQRKMNRICGENWIALNHTAGFVDPLHSTGIAHTLHGLERTLDIVADSWGRKKEMRQRFALHQTSFYRELELIDLLVAGCYMSRTHFKLFHAYSMIYFACTISCEQDRLAGKITGDFLGAGDEKIQNMVRETFSELQSMTAAGISGSSIAAFTDAVRERIEPWNTAGLLNPERRNRYDHTAVSLDNR
ncbi:MAG: tryptophan 7-halogenase [Balneolaceae bacterium]